MTAANWRVPYDDFPRLYRQGWIIRELFSRIMYNTYDIQSSARDATRGAFFFLYYFFPEPGAGCIMYNTYYFLYYCIIRIMYFPSLVVGVTVALGPAAGPFLGRVRLQVLGLRRCGALTTFLHTILPPPLCSVCHLPPSVSYLKTINPFIKKRKNKNWSVSEYDSFFF